MVGVVRVVIGWMLLFRGYKVDILGNNVCSLLKRSRVEVKLSLWCVFVLGGCGNCFLIKFGYELEFFVGF